MATVRHPAVAGRFYPANPHELRAMIREYVDEAPVPEGPAPKAIIALHAGYVYSGPIAGSAYAALAPARDEVSRVVLLGPAHRVPFHGLAAVGVDAFETPLGLVPVDRDAIERIPYMAPGLVGPEKAARGKLPTDTWWHTREGQKVFFFESSKTLATWMGL